MDKIVIFVLCFCVCYAKITIKSLTVPSSVSVDTDEVVLDCDFESQGENVDEIKWYLNDNLTIYQWLPLVSNKPKASERLKNNIDDTYKRTNDNKTMYRAVRLVNLSPKLSGDYSCKVTGTSSEDVKKKRMIVYEPADSDLDLDITEDYSDSNSTEDDLVAVFCNAEGLYPKPDLTISISNDNETKIESLREDEDLDIDEDGLFNITTVVLFDADDLPKSFYYTCELSIPGTDYQLNETKRYTLESDNDTRIESEEDYLNSLNSTTSTEVFEETQEIETQIEEISLKTTTTAEPTNHKDDDDTVKKEDIKENASIRHSPNLNLLSTVLIVAALGPLYL